MIDSDGKINDTLAAESSGSVDVQDTAAENLVTENSARADEENKIAAEADCDAVSVDEAIGDDDTKNGQTEILRVKEESGTQTKITAKAVDTDNDENDGVGEFIGFGIKIAAFTLSVVFLLISILVLVMPFQAMKIYNELGLYDRALESGERYIYSRLKEVDAFGEDERGNFTGITAHHSLTDDEFVEALGVCITISNKLMTENTANKSTEDAKYYAEKLEKFTRMYMCLAGITSINNRKNSANIANVPRIQLRPYVYNYFHSMMKLNYSARAVLGKTDNMMYNIGRAGEIMTNMSERLNTFSGTQQKEVLIDQYVDFVDELNAYLDYEFAKLSLTGANITEPSARDEYSKRLDGSQFSLFIVPLDGFTRVYNVMKETFTEYAQLAYDYDVTAQPDVMDARLHQLYWLLSLSSFVEKMVDMSELLYYNPSAYGASRDAIIFDYVDENSWMVKRQINNGVELQELTELYGILLNRYVSIIQS